MSALTEADLKLKLKSDPIGAYLLCGEEDYLIKIYTDKLVKLSVDESFSDFNLHVFENDDPDLSEIYESSIAVPMMAESKCVLVKNYPISEADDKDIEALEDLLKDNPPDNCLIFSYPALQPKAKELAPMIKLFEKYGSVVKFGRKTQQDLASILERGAKKRDKVFDRGVALYLVTNVGDDLNQLNNELEKVCAYSEGTITRADVDEVCIKSLDSKIYDMVNALISGNFDKAFRSLSALFANREDEFMILGALVSQYTDIYRAKAAAKSGKTAGEVAAAYPSYKGKEFKLSKALNSAKSMSFEQLTKAIEILAEADSTLKSTSQDKKQVLEQVLVRLARVAK